MSGGDDDNRFSVPLYQDVAKQPLLGMVEGGDGWKLTPWKSGDKSMTY